MSDVRVLSDKQIHHSNQFDRVLQGLEQIVEANLLL